VRNPREKSISARDLIYLGKEVVTRRFNSRNLTISVSKLAARLLVYRLLYRKTRQLSVNHNQTMKAKEFL